MRGRGGGATYATPYVQAVQLVFLVSFWLVFDCCVGSGGRWGYNREKERVGNKLSE